MIDFYETHHRFYYERTRDIDPSSFLDVFIRYLPERAVILDVGCGSGRDMKWLKSKGFIPIGLDRSSGLAELAEKHSGCPVSRGDIAEFDFDSLKVDAMMASGSLVHTPHDRLKALTIKMLKCLKPGGIFYASLKAGDDEMIDRFGRRFYLWQEADLKHLFRACGLEILDLTVSNSALNSEDIWLGCIMKNGNDAISCRSKR